MSIARVFDCIARGIEYLCSFFFVIMCAGVTIQVFARYVLASPVTWAEEVARYAMIWIVYLGSIVAVRRKAHTRIDFFVNLLPARYARYVGVMVDSVCIIFLSILVYSSQPILKIGMRLYSFALKIPLIYIYGALPLCALFMIAFFTFNIVQTLRSVEPGSKPENEQGV